MTLASHTVSIDRDPAAVFDYFTDFSKASRWRQYVASMTPVGGGPLTAGSRVHVVMNVAGATHTFELEVLACDRPSLWRHRTNEPHFRGYVEYRFTPHNGGTVVTMTMKATPVGVYGWLAVPLLLLRRRRTYAEQLPQLKKAMEEQ